MQPALPIKPRQPDIILAEDDPDFRAMLHHSLRSMGYSVDAYPDGDTLLRSLDPRRPPRLLICDYRMPGVLGTEVVSTVRSWGWRIPTFLISAFAERVLGVQQAIDANLVISKPFAVADLMLAVHCFLSPRR